MKKQKDDIVKNTIFLVVLTLILGTILGSVYYVTKEPIAKQDQIKHDAALVDVFPDAAEFQMIELTDDLASEFRNSLDGAGLAKQTIDEVNAALDASGAEIGHIYSVTSSEGYGGDIQFVEYTDDHIVRVQLQGHCVGCPGATMTIKGVIERLLKETYPEIQGVEAV